MSTTRLHSATLTAVALVLALAQRVALLVRFACILMVHPVSPARPCSRLTTTP